MLLADEFRSQRTKWQEYNLLKSLLKRPKCFATQPGSMGAVLGPFRPQQKYTRQHRTGRIITSIRGS